MPHKRRSWRVGLIRLWHTGPLSRWPRIAAVGTGYMAFTLVERLFVWAKKVTPVVTTLRRFWLNTQATVVVTRKPANVRMGKGKGSRAGVHAYVQPGLTLLALSQVRSGALSALYRRLCVRCAFALCLVGKPSTHAQQTLFHGQQSTWVRLRRIQASYITEQFTLLRDTIRQLRRPPILGYFTRIFWWRYITPHAVWAPARPERRRARVRRRVVRHRRYLTRLRPLGLGFLRQLRVHIRARSSRVRGLLFTGWRRVRTRILRSLWSVAVMQLTPQLPWYALLRAKRYRRLLPLIAYVSACAMSGGADTSSALSCGLAEPAISAAVAVQVRHVLQAQLYAALLFSAWSRVGLGTLDLRWLRYNRGRLR